MRVIIGADHAGFAMKEHLREFLVAAGHEIVDVGPASEESVDYPDFAAAVGRRISDRETRGVLVCGTGIGMAIAANKLRGIRAANCNDLFMAELCRRHNDANVLTLGSRVIAPAYAEAIVMAFLDTPYDGGRHQQRLDKIASLSGADR